MSKNVMNQNSGGGGAGASLWSMFPATGNVNMANNYISNLRGINESATSVIGNVLTISADKSIVWAPASGALWATYNAVQNVNLSGNSIINVNNISTGTLNASVDVYIQGKSVSLSIITLSQGVSNLSGYVYTQVPSICGAITSLSGTVSNLSGYVYTQVPSICGAITSLSGTVSNLSGYVYTQVPNICGAITSLSGYVYSLSSAQFWANFAAVNNVNMSGFSISNISSEFISNNATISGTLTVSAEVVRNNLNVSGLTTVSGLVVQNTLDVSGTTNTRGLTISGISFPDLPPFTDLMGSRYVLTLSDSSTFSWRRPPQATYGTADPPGVGPPMPGVPINFGISGDVYFKVSSVNGGQVGSSVTLFFA